MQQQKAVNHGLDPSHEHVFQTGDSAGAERGTRIVLAITLVTMGVEITAGWWFNSMALLADGWHMSSHALAIGLSVLAYAAARRYARDPRFAFGTWKIEVLSGFASAILLLGVALSMVVASVERLVAPQAIRYEEAIWVAVLGLIVNLVCAAILSRSHRHDGHAHHHGHAHAEGGGDLNLRAAYIHVLADAATSVLAVLALLGGRLYGWAWLDPAIGIAGAVLVAVWAKGLIADTAKALLDREMDHPVVAEIREVVEVNGDRISDLHVWRVGRAVYACAIAVLTKDEALTADGVRQRLSVHEEIVHSTVEIHRRLPTD